jgi:hypothetical protein
MTARTGGATVSEGLTYADALTILGQRKSRLVTVLDAVGSVGLTVWAATAWATGSDAGVPLNMFELKNDVVRHGHALLARAAEWRSGLSRFDRTQRLAAAHAVLVISSYFEALGEVDLPVPLERLASGQGEQAAHATGDAVPRSYVQLIEVLVSDRLPMPESHRPYAQTRQEVQRVHARLAERLVAFAKTSGGFDEYEHALRARMATALGGPATLRGALARYDAAFSRLAADNHEFAVWASLTEAHALGASLAGVAELLGAMAARRAGDGPRVRLSRNYHAALDEPLIGAAASPEGVVVPSLREAYINPRCQVAEVGPADMPGEHTWWQDRELIADPERFLAGHLTSLRATQSPLVVLGEPGSGKSTFTEVLAARLPEGEFLPVRVELRSVPAESMLQEQIEHSVYRELGERVAWNDLVDAGDGALPVVLLDGFDELVQASGVNRYDYLEQVRDFQRVQARIGRPLAVVVTSRTLVAGRTRFPYGTVTVRLLPFSEDQVRAWLEAWNRRNSAELAIRGLLPLNVETALAHPELAEQPLLLMLLALFDAAGNALQNQREILGQAELYQALLMDFSLREVRKSPANRALPTGQQRELAERELHRLAIVALAMFVRRRQSVTAAELDHDLSLLAQHRAEHEPPRATAGAPSPSDQATGRFFFLHRSEATPHGERTRSYEFLHATFGEFLIAWLTVRALCDMDAVREVMRRGMTGSADGLDDGFLHALLSFSSLAERRPTVDFLSELLTRLPHPQRLRIRQMLTELLAGALYPPAARSHTDYEPTREPIPRRLAAYSFNLTLLTVLIADEEVSGAELYGTQAAIEHWIGHAHLWHGQFSADEWHAVVDLLRVRVARVGQQITVFFRREDGAPAALLDSIAIVTPPADHSLSRFEVLASTIPDASYDIAFPSTSPAGRIVREIAYLPNWRTTMLLLQSIPFLRATGPTVRWHLEEGSYLAGTLLAELDYARDTTPEHRLALYRTYVDVMTQDQELLDQFLLRLGADIEVLPPSAVLDILRRAKTGPATFAYLRAVDRLWHHVSSTATRQDPNTRQMIIALVRSLHPTTPDTHLNRLSSGLLVAARTNHGRTAA